MTIVIDDGRADRYVATAGQAAFTFTFQIYEDDDIDVYQTPAGQIPNPTADLLPASAYVVTLNGAVPSTGFITLNVPASLNDLITIQGDIALKRTTDFSVGGENFTPAEMNVQLDKIVIQIQQVEDKIVDVGLSYQVTDPLQPRDRTIPQLPVGHVWQMSANGIVAVNINGGDVNTLRSELASETQIAPGSGLVGHYNSVDLLSTTVFDQLNTNTANIETNEADILINTLAIEEIEKDTAVFAGVQSGLETQNDAVDLAKDILFKPGTAGSNDLSKFLTLPANLIKKVDAAWAEGTNMGGLFTGAVAATTTYHFFIIEKDSDGTIDAGFDTSVTAANRPVGWTNFARVWSMTTDATPDWTRYKQIGDDCLLHTPDHFFNGVAPTVPTNINTKAPIDIELKTYIHIEFLDLTGAALGIVQTPLVPDITISAGKANLFGDPPPTPQSTFGYFNIYTNVAADIRLHSNVATSSASMNLWGWTDSRGKT